MGNASPPPPSPSPPSPAPAPSAGIPQSNVPASNSACMASANQQYQEALAACSSSSDNFTVRPNQLAHSRQIRNTHKSRPKQRVGSIYV